MGPLDEPPNSNWPKGYPTGSIAKPVTGLANSGTTESVAAAAATNPATAPVATQGAAFTKSGAWIDPNMRKPVINPNADQDSWHLNDSTSFGY